MGINDESTLRINGSHRRQRHHGHSSASVTNTHQIPFSALEADIHSYESMIPFHRPMQHRILARGIAFIVMTS